MQNLVPSSLGPGEQQEDVPLLEITLDWSREQRSHTGNLFGALTGPFQT